MLIAASFGKKIVNKFFAAALGALFVFGIPYLERVTGPKIPLPSSSGGMVLFVFDVGQGDAILAQEGDRQILLDGGPDTSILEKLGAAMPAGDREIDLVVLTHPHADHVNGLASVLERYKVGRVLATGASGSSAGYRRWKEGLEEQNIPVDDPRDTPSETVAGMRYDVLSSGGAEETKSGKHDGNTDGLNDTSITGLLSYGSRRFLLMGDATVKIEEALMEGKKDISADFLKVGHHGSAYSTGENFLRAVSPDYAAISVGEGNPYGLPAWRTLLLLDEEGVKTYRTDRDGTAAAITDGKSLQVLAEKIR